jgi:nucleotide-binding universal stress UspA family protein
MLKKILVPVRGDTLVDAVLGHAAALARRHSAHVVVAHCRAQPEELLPYSTLLPAFARDTILSQAYELAEQQERKVRDDLHGLAGRLGLTEAGPLEGEATVEVIEQEERMPDAVKHLGRLADLIVVARPDRDRELGVSALKAALFQTGRPVLMCPREGSMPDTLGRRVAVGWNGSLEAARAVALTLDIAGAADEVTILAGGRGEPHGATTEELVEYYALRGVTAQPLRFEARNPGAALLEKTAEVGADLLVMGAYGHSHERETLFGGNTQTVVDRAALPVVLVH